ncbi:hypothetical protein P7K49_006026, partial [Saguinus oedipus]
MCQTRLRPDLCVSPAPLSLAHRIPAFPAAPTLRDLTASVRPGKIPQRCSAAAPCAVGETETWNWSSWR